MNSKKGISPLIATVLIIGFTIVLAAVVMQWGSGFVKDLTKTQAERSEGTTKCVSIDFSMNVDNTVAQKLTLTNNAEIAIDSFIVQKIVDGESSDLAGVNFTTGLTGYQSSSEDYTDTLSTGNQIRVIPEVKLANGVTMGCGLESAETYTI